MNILLIGGGGREHAIAEALAKDSTLYSLMPKKNPAIANLSKDYAICDIENPEIVKKNVSVTDVTVGADQEAELWDIFHLQCSVSLS